jgi:hypothetical protein
MKPDDVDLDVRGPQQPTDKRSVVSGEATPQSSLSVPDVSANREQSLGFGQSDVFWCLFLALMLLTRC